MITKSSAMPAENPPKRGARKLAVAALAMQASALLRYMLLARILGPFDLGLAATLLLVVSFFDQTTDCGIDRYLIQRRGADTREALRLLHRYAISRGALVALALIGLAVPFSRSFGQAELAWGFAVMAIYPFVFGFRHLDYRRQQRHNDFRAESAIVLHSEIASLAGTILGLWLFGDYRAVIVGLTLRALTIVILSHCFSEWPYRIGGSKCDEPALRAFAWPLAANGLVLFAATQGDRVMVGQIAGAEALGLYSAALLLFYFPLNICQKLLASLSLPEISAAQGNDLALRRSVAALGGQALVIAIAGMWGFALLGTRACAVIFGPEFAQDSTVAGLVAIFLAVRFMRVWPTNAELAAGRSGLLLAANLVRLISLPLALVLAQRFDSLVAILSGFAIGEFTALAVSIALANRTPAKPMANGVRYLTALAFAALAVLAADAALAWQDYSLAIVAVISALVTIALALTQFVDFLRWGSGEIRHLLAAALRFAPQRL